MLHNLETDMVATSKQPTTDIWLVADWDEYIKNIEHPAYKKAKGYYYSAKYRIEMTPVGNEHSQDHSIINQHSF